ncbi:MAG: guanylate kinase, partial [Actinomycetota bacterium]|nr:guanylate kinase [Actinomycetota bacterium]
ATEDLEAMEARMTTARSEVAARDEFDFEVVNEDRERAREDIIEVMWNIVGEGEDEDAERA